MILTGSIQVFVFNQDRKASFLAASKAMDEIARLRLPVTPEIFAVFYAQGCGEPAAVGADLRNLADRGHEIGIEEILDIWRRHIGGCDAAATSDIIAEFERLANRITEKLSADDSAKLESAVSDLAREIAVAGMPESVKSSLLTVVRNARSLGKRDRNITEEVRTTAGTIQKLQAQLDEALKEVARAREDARRDVLTEVGNRRAFDEFLEKYFAESSNRSRPLSMIVIDLDHFKQVNDKHGHKFGDVVLQSAARRFSASVRENGTVYRLGGEEFCILLPGIGMTHARILADQVRGSLESKSIPEARDAAFGVTITASLGVAERKSNDTPESLFKRADKAAYRAKELGRNRVVSLM